MGLPQRFLISSEVKCAHFHGTRVAKPIPSHQVYKGTVFELVDHAVDFVLSKIALSVGTRAESVQAPVAYEISKEVVTEAIVNAVAHRDYTSDASVQVMLFADRLEVWNPGALPPPLTLDKLRVPHESVPGNPLLARAMYLVKYIEQMGTGTLDMIERCVGAGLREPDFEAAGRFVTRIRRAALAGQPVVFTDRDDVRSKTKWKADSQPESRRESQLGVGAARVGVGAARVGVGAARVDPARVTARAAEDEGAWAIGWRAPVEGGACPAGWVRSRRPASSTRWSVGSWPTV